jgi:hypothetical protein
MPDVKFEIVQSIACLEDAKKHLMRAKNSR